MMKVKIIEDFFHLSDFEEICASIEVNNLEIFDPELDIVQKCNKNFYQCNFCHKSYNNKRSFIRHADFHEGRYTCSYCRQKCTSRTTLEIHLNRCHKKEAAEEVPFDDKENVTKTHIWCSLCKRYIRKSFLQFHLKRSHVNEKRRENLNELLCLLEANEVKPQLFKCHLCDKSYDNYSSFKTHRNIHSDKFLCQICNKANASLTALRRHFKSHKINCDQDNLEHDTNYVFCELCSKYVNKARLKFHQRTVHEKKFPTCDYCKRAFQTKAVSDDFWF